MKELPFDGVASLVAHVGTTRPGAFFLYRGQAIDLPLLPKAARLQPDADSTDAERRLVHELRQRGAMLLDTSLDDWDLLCIGQQHGAPTRLLDWTTNPLVALWMALDREPVSPREQAFVYAFEAKDSWRLDPNKRGSPFTTRETRVLQPPLNNERVAAQSGWFTTHSYSKSQRRFVPLEENDKYRNSIFRFRVAMAQRDELLVQLDRLGVNAQAMYPGLEGLCRYMAWRHEHLVLEAAHKRLSSRRRRRGTRDA